MDKRILAGILVVVILVIAGAYFAVSKEEQNEVNVGMLMPLTGDLSDYGGPMRDGGKLAVERINQAGGILDNKKINLIVEDTETSETAAHDAASKLINVNDVPVIIGPAGSGTSMAILETTKAKKVVQISPSATSPDFTDVEDDGYFFRTVPSDALQGLAMAKLAISEGYETASTLVLNNPYGVGFEGVFIEEFEGRGGTVLNSVRYDPGGTTFESEIDSVSQGDPDVIMLVSYPETGSVILSQAYEAEVMEKSDWLLSEGLRSDDFAETVGKTGEGEFIIDGFKGTGPDPRVTGPAYEEFKAAYESKYNKEPGIFNSNTYDAVALAVLAIQEAGEAEGPAVKEHMKSVANPPGTKVTDLAEAIALLKQGKDIDYQGTSGELTLNDVGDVYGKYARWHIENGDVALGSQIQVVEE